MSVPSAAVGMWVSVAFLGIIAYGNWRTLKVPNKLLAAFLLCFFPVAWLSGMPLDEVALRGAVCAATLLVFFLLFVRDIVGGGGAKLVVVTVLWLPSSTGMAFGLLCILFAGMLYGAERLTGARWPAALAEQYASIAAVLGIALSIAAGAAPTV